LDPNSLIASTCFPCTGTLSMPCGSLFLRLSMFSVAEEKEWQCSHP